MSTPSDTPVAQVGRIATRASGSVPLLQSEREEILALAQQLIRIDTTNPPGGELAAAQHMALYLESAGVEVSLLPFAEGRANLIARIPGDGASAALLLSGHLDTVPVDDPAAWSVPHLGALERDGRLYGRGALDMKGAIAAMAVAMRNLARLESSPSGDVVLALTAGEETDSCGAEILCARGVLADVGAAIIGEPTDLDIGIAHRGALWLRVEAAGQAGHGSQPSAARNAIEELLRWLGPAGFLDALLAEPVDPLLGRGTVSLNMIGGGTSANVIPDRACAVLDIRTVPGSDPEAILSSLRARPGEVTLTLLRHAPPIQVSADAALVGAAEAAVQAVTGEAAVKRGLPYMTDGSIFVKALDIPAIVIGPGPEADAHTDDESVSVDQLAQAAAIYESVVRQLLYD